VEFPVEIGPFFGLSPSPVVGQSVDISLVSAGVRFPPKKLDFHHNNVWRLNLPTPRQGHGPYAKTVLCFETTPTSSLYRLTVVTQGSPLHRALRRATQAKGVTRSRTRASGVGRKFGYF
jgi:hypothetical protein